jgi:hypothetical protein
MKIYFINIFFVFMIHSAFAQKSFYILSGSDLGGGDKGYSFGQKGTVLKDGYGGILGTDRTSGFKLQYQPNRYFGIETGFLYSNMFFAVYDSLFILHNNLKVYNTDNAPNKWSEPGYMGITRGYLTPQISLYGYLPIYRSINLYASVGLAGNFLLGKSNLQKNYTYTPGESMQLSGAYKKSLSSNYFEIGVKLGKKVPFFFSYKRSFGGYMVNSDYTRTQNGNSTATDKVSVHMSYQAFSIWSGFNFLNDVEKQRRKIKHAQKKMHHHDEETKKRSVPSRTPAHTTDSTQDIPKSIEGRTVHITQAITVRSNEIIIRVWDDETVDGDILSLNLNGQWILSKYLLQAAPYKLEEVLKAGTNYLILHADSEGKSKPCTAAVIIYDGVREQKIILNSDLNTSSTIIINVVK